MPHPKWCIVQHEKARNYWMIGLEEAGDRYQSGWEIQNDDTKYQLNQFGLEEYTEKEKGWWKDSNIILANTEKDIEEFIRTKVHKKTSCRLYSGKISTKLGEHIKADTGIDVTNYNIAITSEFENSHSDAKKKNPGGRLQ